MINFHIFRILFVRQHWEALDLCSSHHRQQSKRINLHGSNVIWWYHWNQCKTLNLKLYICSAFSSLLIYYKVLYIKIANLNLRFSKIKQNFCNESRLMFTLAVNNYFILTYNFEQRTKYFVKKLTYFQIISEYLKTCLFSTEC